MWAGTTSQLAAIWSSSFLRRKFLKRACEVASKGWGQPAFYNTEAIIQELMNAGKSLEDARKGGCSGCVAAPGPDPG